MTLQQRVLNQEFARECAAALFRETPPGRRGTSLRIIFDQARTRSADLGTNAGTDATRDHGIEMAPRKRKRRNDDES